MYFESHVTVRWRVKVATSRMVIKVDRLLRHAYNAVCVCVRICGRCLPLHAGMVPLQVPLLVQVLVTALSAPVITYPS